MFKAIRHTERWCRKRGWLLVFKKEIELALDLSSGDHRTAENEDGKCMWKNEDDTYSLIIERELGLHLFPK
jgi:hypothetical protein